MTVNPVYSTNPAVNPQGVSFGDPVPSSFPKGDAYCYQAPAKPNGVVPPSLCSTDWMPYARSLSETAQVTRVAANRARIVENDVAVAPSDSWKREAAQFLGRRSILSLTDTPSADLFGVQTARLSRAGDDGTARAFIAPHSAGLAAGVAGMAAGSELTVLVPTPSNAAPGGYPLTSISYAAVAPLALDADARQDYAAFLEYAAGAGQNPGLRPGDLPPGLPPAAHDVEQSNPRCGRVDSLDDRSSRGVGA